MYNICIVGAGPVGLTLAAALTKFGMNGILIMDAMSQPVIKHDAIPNQRVISVNQSTKRIFQSIGAWEQINKLNKFTRMIVDEQGVNSALHFNHQEAYIIEYDHIVNALHSVIPNVDIQYNTKMTDLLVQTGSYARVNNQYDCKLVVGSDGNRSKVKESQRIGTHGFSYNQMGLVCTVQTMGGDGNTAYQTYLRNGYPLALLPLSDQHSSIVWSLSLDDYSYLMKLGDEQFLTHLNENISPQMPRITHVLNKRMGFPLSSLQAERYISDRVALIGDAAHSIHPMAGQGMNMGINDAALLANNIIKNSKTGNDYGSVISLQQFEAQAKLMNYTTGIAMNGIKSLYESQVLRDVRQFGTRLLDQIQPLKDLMMQQASQHPLAPTVFEWNK